VGKNIGNISKLSFGGSVDAKDNVGGIVGYDNNGSISEVFSSGFVSGNTSVGGLVGKANDANELGKTTITNSSVMVFDTEEFERPTIIGSNKVGGLVGSFEGYLNGSTKNYSKIENSYIRSYIKFERTNFTGDMYVQSINAYVGGLVGYASLAKINKAYSKLTINAENATIGGLVGFADNYEFSNTYEQNLTIGNTQYDGIIVGRDGQNGGIVNYFYGTHNGSFVGEQQANSLINYVVNRDGNKNENSWQNWNIATGTDDLTGADWYLEHSINWYVEANQNIYPYILFTSAGAKTVMAVEPPTEIKIQVNNTESSARQYLKEIVADNGTKLVDTYVIFKGSSNSLKFSDLFDVRVLPESNVLNISKDYYLTSSNTSIAQIIGKTQGEFRLKLVSTGTVTITATSKLDADVKKSITLYVLNAVKDFRISKTETSTIVGSLHELKISMAQNYANNSDFYIRMQHDSRNYDIVSINGVLAQSGDPATQTIYLNNFEKIFVGSRKSGTYQLTYSLFVDLNIDGETYTIALPNDKGSTLEYISGTIQLNFVYGINNFVVDARNVFTGFNDVAQIMFTLTGDDLRLTGSGVNGRGLPKIVWGLNGTNMTQYWNVELSSAYIYTSAENDAVPSVVQFTKIPGRTGYTINDYTALGTTQYNTEIVKIEFVFRVEINKNAAQEFYKNNTSSEAKLETDMTTRIWIL
ncbi:MAG: hypothetical protein J6T39_01540, partial [Clostridia bacterium]|nr:hypothetical protein [Clostridia bacterium]